MVGIKECNGIILNLPTKKIKINENLKMSGGQLENVLDRLTDCSFLKALLWPVSLHPCPQVFGG